MKVGLGASAAILTALGWLGSGCRAHPVSMGVMLLGDVVADADVEKREKELLGGSADDADAMFGERVETLVDLANEERSLLLYKVDSDVLSVDRYLVEVTDDKVVAISKAKENIDGIEDVVKAVDFESKMIGKSPDECVDEGGLKDPLARFHSVNTGDRVFVYDVRNFTNTRGARYCVLRFDESNKCHKVRLLGVSASTKKEPATG